MDALGAAVIRLSVGFFFHKDVNARAISHVIITVEHMQRASGNRSI